jgi:hypothetical protein
MVRAASSAVADLGGVVVSEGRLGLQNGQGVGDGTSAGRAGRGENFIIAHGGS